MSTEAWGEVLLWDLSKRDGFTWEQGLCPEPQPSQTLWSTPWRPHYKRSQRKGSGPEQSLGRSGPTLCFYFCPSCLCFTTRLWGVLLGMLESPHPTTQLVLCHSQVSCDQKLGCPVQPLAPSPTQPKSALDFLESQLLQPALRPQAAYLSRPPGGE